MGILSKLMGKKEVNYREEYTPERAEGLKQAKAMYQQRVAYEKGKQQFERKLSAEQNDRKLSQKFQRGVSSVIKRVAVPQNRGRQSISPRTSNVISRNLTGRNIVRTKSKSGRTSSRVGRPKGPSGRYIIPGKGAVGVYEYRKYSRYQNAMKRIQTNQMISNLMQKGYSPQQINEIVAQNQLKQTSRVQQVQSKNNVPYEPQQTGVTLNTGWNLFKVGFNSPSRPINVNRQLEVFNVDKPVTNPSGEYYTTPDLFTGRQILQRRNQDKLFQW